MIRREEVRLRALFRRLALVSLPMSAGAGAIACSQAATSGGDVDASVAHDASTAMDAGTQEAAADSAGDTATEARSCDPGPVTAFDAGGDAGPGCAYAIDYPCGLPSFVTMLYPPACYLALRDCAQICTGPAMNPKDCRVAENYGCDAVGAFVAPDGGPIKIECAMCAGVGRRPRGLIAARFDASSALGDFFARVAHLEAASVDAFMRLRAELALRHAPRALVRMAERCARDERRHARVTARIARRHGGRVPAVRVAKARKRSATAMAIENAVEGCVRETFGAMVATWQAANAGDAEIASAMTRIAIDETRHAAMAWAVARWIDASLDARQRARVARARARAVDAVRAEIAEPHPSLVRDAGMPTAARARALLEAVEAELWS